MSEMSHFFRLRWCFRPHLEGHGVPNGSAIELFRLSDAVCYPELRLFSYWSDG
jgi:hypothetical protein